jgi:hypothetical protein
MVLAGCADEAGPEKSTGVVGQADTPESEATSEATAALDALQRGATAPIAVRWSRFGTAQTLQGALGVRLPATSAGEARRFLFDRAELFGLRGAVAVELANAAGRESLIGKHFTFAQTHRGVPVHGAEVKVHVNAAGDVIGVNNSVVPDLDVDPNPSVSAATALKIALNAVGVDSPVELQMSPEAPALVVEVDRGAPALAWRVVVPTLGPTWELFVDAQTGALRAAAEDLNRYINGTGKVFRVNAVVATQNNRLVDNRDSAAAVPAAAYSVVTLQGLTGNGKLEGSYASSAGSKTHVTSAAHNFSYDRSITSTVTRFRTTRCRASGPPPRAARWAKASATTGRRRSARSRATGSRTPAWRTGTRCLTRARCPRVCDAWTRRSTTPRTSSTRCTPTVSCGRRRCGAFAGRSGRSAQTAS